MVSAEKSGKSATLTRLHHKYVTALCGLVFIDLAITGVFLTLTGNQIVAGRAALANLLIFGLINGIGAYFIFAYFCPPTPKSDSIRQNLRSLPIISAVWAVIITFSYFLIIASSGDFIAQNQAFSQSEKLFAAAWYALIYVTLYAGYAYLVAQDIVQQVRLLPDWQMPPLQAKYANRLCATLAFVAGLPIILVILDLTILSEFRYSQGLTTSEIVLMDLLAAGIAVSAAFFFAVRSLTHPVRSLETAIKNNRDNGYDIAAISSDDEIGRLTLSFNKMMAERQKTEEKVSYLANNDLLTGLFNRNGFIEKLHTQPRSADTYVIAINIIDFRTINDGLGHLIGNTVLKAIADRLRLRLPDAPLARLYGDIFAISVQSDLDVFAQNLSKYFREPFDIEGNRLRIYPQAGAAHCDHSHDPETALQHAIMVMKDPNQHHMHPISIYEKTIQSNIHRRQILLAGLQDALYRNELSTHYQPIIDLKTLQPVGFEALMRWTQNGHAHSPAEFIPIAETSGLILELGEWLIRRVVMDLKEFNQVKDSIYVAINFSGKQIEDGKAQRTLSDTLRKFDLPSRSVSVEVTETLALDDTAFPVAQHLSDFIENGFLLSLDDFGTGHSSLMRLKDISANQIKIDQGFIKGMGSDQRKSAIVRHTLALADSLDLDVVGEGIESAEELDMLRSFGCPKGQGYYFSKPLPFAEAQQYLKDCSK